MSIADFLPAYPDIEEKSELFPDSFEKSIFELKEFNDLTIHPDRPTLITKGIVGLRNQQVAFGRYASYLTPYDRLFVFHSMGTGKCHGLNTPILMYDGTIKMVQDVIVGDQLMGDDSTPRNVLKLARGWDDIYTIKQKNGGDDYTVNSDHVLSMKHTCPTQITKLKNRGVSYYVVKQLQPDLTYKSKWFNFKKGEEAAKLAAEEYMASLDKVDNRFDIPLQKYLGLAKTLRKEFKGYRTGVEFEKKEVPFDPYMLGLWLGDGTSLQPAITNIDKEILDYIYQYAEQNNYGVSVSSDGITYRFKTEEKTKGCNKFINFLNDYKLYNNKHIPHLYKANSRDIRLKVLAGLLDSDGYYSSRDGYYEISQKNSRLASDILYLARSLGFRAQSKKVNKSCMYKGEKKTGEYNLITISGAKINEIPVLLPRKKAETKPNKDQLRNEIEVVLNGEGDYFGFLLDGNHRYLLGDFTVTHNTILALYAIEETISDPKSSIRKAVIFVKSKKDEPNFYNSILRLTGKKYYPEKRDSDEVDQILADEAKGKSTEQHKKDYKKLELQIRKNIQKNYTFRHFREFGNEVDPEIPIPQEDKSDEKKKKSRKKKDAPAKSAIKAPKKKRERLSDSLIRDEYSNRFLLVDECHHLHVEKKSEEDAASRTFRAFWKVFHQVHNSKIILMSGTPITNKPNEIADLLNLLLPVDRQLPTGNPFDERFIQNGVMNAEELKPYMKGMITSLRAISTNAKILYVGNKVIGENGIKNREGKDGEPQVGYIVQELIMSPFQSDNYIAFIDEGGEKFKMKSKSATNFIFPDGKADTAGYNAWLNIPKPGQGKKGGPRGPREYTDKSKPIPELSDVFKRELMVKSGNRLDIDAMIDKLSKYSVKFAYTVRILMGRSQFGQAGCTYIYNNRVKGGGCILFAGILKLFGYERTNGYINLSPGNKRPRFAIMTNLTLDDGGKMAAQIQKTFNDPLNANGEYIQVIIGSDISSEGISFFNVEHIIPHTPHFNYAKLDQAIARGLRYKSHDVISAIYEREGKGQFNVKIHQLAAIPQKNGVPLPDKSVDVYFYKRSFSKDLKIKKIERAMREMSFDCSLNRWVNTSGVDYSRNCDYELCDYKCEGVETADIMLHDPSMRESKKYRNNYDLFYSETERVQLQLRIMAIFRKTFTRTFDQLREETGASGFLLLTTLKEMIDKDTPVINRYSFVCYLREYKDVYFIVDTLEKVTNDLYVYYTMYPKVQESGSVHRKVVEYRLNASKTTLDRIRSLTLRPPEDYKVYGEMIIRMVKSLPVHVQYMLVEMSVDAQETKFNQGEELIRANEMYGLRRFLLDYYKANIYRVPGKPVVVRLTPNIYHCRGPKVGRMWQWEDCSGENVVTEAVVQVRIDCEEGMQNRYKFYGVEDNVNNKFWVTTSELAKPKVKGNEISRGAECGTGKNNGGKILLIAFYEGMDKPELVASSERMNRNDLIAALTGGKFKTLPDFDPYTGITWRNLNDNDLRRLWRLGDYLARGKLKPGAGKAYSDQGGTLCEALRLHFKRANKMCDSNESNRKGAGRNA